MIKANLFAGSLIMLHFVCKIFILVHCTELELRSS